MNILQKYNNFIERFGKIRTFIYYAVVLIELLLMIYEKTDLPLSSPRGMFRLTFLLCVLVVLLTPYSLKQWGILILTFGFTFICYRITGNNDLFRFAMFIAASKDVNLDKLSKSYLMVTLAGFLGIAMCAALGAFGNLSLTYDYGRKAGVETRYVLGFGHPNALHGALFAVIILFIYVIEKRRPTVSGIGRLVTYAGALLLNVFMFFLTDSRTGLVINCFAILMAIVLHYAQGLRKARFTYIAGSAVVAFCVAFSVWAAAISAHAKDKHSFYKKLDKLLTGRIWSLYQDTRTHKGTLETWTLFGNEFSGNSFFDMGWVRMFYWYGIIPSCLILVLIALILYRVYKKRDYATLILFVTISVYTIIEAAFMSSYIGRNFLLPVAGVYLLGSKWEDNSARKEQILS
ncbi:MAG: hypothetical protein K6G06_09415 [Butyrivibrio sp.]|nr:hypothetical protein [Butyrivibrio sp.]